MGIRLSKVQDPSFYSVRNTSTSTILFHSSSIGYLCALQKEGKKEKENLSNLLDLWDGAVISLHLHHISFSTIFVIERITPKRNTLSCLNALIFVQFDA